ncbi:MAG: site-2 protease family protein, partial [Planctomycetota bacterium]
KVDRFSLGFPFRPLGPPDDPEPRWGGRLWGFRWGETDCCVSIIPLGGYVAMAGEDPDDPDYMSERSLQRKTVGQRALVMSAGVIMNVIFAVIGFLVAFKVGVDMDVPVVGSTMPGSAAHGQLMRGDRILAIDDEEPLDFVDVALAAAFADGDIKVKVDRLGEEKTLLLKPKRTLGEEIQRLGISPIDAVAQFEEGSPAGAAGLQPKDWILAATPSGHPTVNDSLGGILEALEKSPGVATQLLVQRGAERLALTLTPESRPMKGFGLTFSSAPVVIAVVEDAPAEEGGLEAGDVIVSINGAASAIDNVVGQVKAIAGSETPVITMEITRQGASKTLKLKPLTRDTNAPVIGASFGRRVIESVTPGSPADKAGIGPGATILTIAEREVAISGEETSLARYATGLEGEVEITWAEGAEQKSAKLTPIELPDRTYGWHGIVFSPSARFKVTRPGLIDPIRVGVHRTWMFTSQVFMTIKGMFTSKISPKTLGGPIAISTQAFAITQRGTGTLIYFLCIISINLAVLNILPIPMLDGGHLMFLLIEKLKGSPVSPMIQIRAQQVGLLLVLFLIVFVTKNDIMRLIRG